MVYSDITCFAHSLIVYCISRHIKGDYRQCFRLSSLLTKWFMNSSHTHNEFFVKNPLVPSCIESLKTKKSSSYKKHVDKNIHDRKSLWLHLLRPQRHRHMTIQRYLDRQYASVMETRSSNPQWWNWNMFVYMRCVCKYAVYPFGIKSLNTFWMNVP